MIELIAREKLKLGYAISMLRFAKDVDAELSGKIVYASFKAFLMDAY